MEAFFYMLVGGALTLLAVAGIWLWREVRDDMRSPEEMLEKET